MNKKIPLIIIIALLTAGVVILLRDWGSGLESPEILIEYSDSSMVESEPVREYGIPIDSFIIHPGRIRKNQTLSTLLNEFGIPAKTVDDVSRASIGVFDFRKLRYGNPYKIYCTPDSFQIPNYLVYEHTPVEYIKVRLKDSISVEKQEKEINIVQKTASGMIRTSLWNTMLEKDLDPMLAFDLSEIFAWSIDFFGLQEGDFFKVIYEEHFADTNYIGLGNIHAAYFEHAEHAFFAIPFVQDSLLSFFDEEGSSLRKAFLKAPLRYSRISSRYSNSRLHPILKIRRPHLGVDYAAPIGTPVLSIGDGRIIELSYTKGSGRMIRIQHNSVYATAYLHLSGYGKDIREGAFVKQGTVVGYVGSTGLSTGPHLDFRFYKNGYPIDPLKVESPPVEPVKEEYLQLFDSIKTEWINKLDLVILTDSVAVPTVL